MAAKPIFSMVSEESSRDALRTSGDDESLSNEQFIQANLPSSGLASRNSSSRTSIEAAFGESFREITASNLHEYSWPMDSMADKYFIQEQLAVFLDVKSFKRKYPDLVRRAIVESEEKTYLLKNEVVTLTQLNMGLAALRAEDIYDLMTNDYPEKFEEYKKVVAERNKQAMAIKQMELQAVKSDSKRLEEWRKKAMRSVGEWNTDLNRDRKTRSSFFDMTTMVIQEPIRKRARQNRAYFGSYPTSMITGQFQEFHKKYSMDELFSLPVNSMSRADDYIPSKRPHSPVSIVVNPEEIIHAQMEDARRAKEAEAAANAAASTPKSRKVSRRTSVQRMSMEEGRGEETGENCAFCQEDLYQNDRYVQCSKCGSCGHPQCLENMTDEMYETVKTYNWMCMECKPCSICSRLDEEDKMLFCDRCDRGYHTFCVGLAEPPSGRWVCPKFCMNAPAARRGARSAVNDKAAEAAVADVISTPSSLKPKASLDRTVDEVTEAVLSGLISANDIPSYFMEDLKSNSSLSNSPRSATPDLQAAAAASTSSAASAKYRRNSINKASQPTTTPYIMCKGCGESTGTPRKGKGCARKILYCANCVEAKNKPAPTPEDVSNGSESQG